MVKPVLKEANYSDDDVWEPSLRKEKPPVPAPKPSRHSTNKKVFYFYFTSNFIPFNNNFCFRKKQREDTVPLRLLGNIAAERELLRRQILEVKAKLKNLRLGINKRYRAEYDFIYVGIFCYYQPDFRLSTAMVPNASTLPDQEVNIAVTNVV